MIDEWSDEYDDALEDEFRAAFQALPFEQPELES